MMDLKARKDLLKELGIRLEQVSREIAPEIPEISSEWSALLSAVQSKNPWFTRASVHRALCSWSAALAEPEIERWVSSCPIKDVPERILNVGVINAGNIPFVGLHDLLTVFMSGHRYVGKNASDDPFLLPWIVQIMKSVSASVEQSVGFADKIIGMDAVIATGSDNSARYFEYYFGKQPHVIRRNRNGVAVLSGKETEAELKALGRDIFDYYGLGCRNVSKLYVPEGYDFSRLFESLYDYHEVMSHHKYMNNFDYHQAVYLLKRLPFLQNNFLILIEDERIPSPLAVVHYEKYKDISAAADKLESLKESLQCVVAGEETIASGGFGRKGLPLVGFGRTQFPSLTDYADGVDTLRFLSGL
ncbi:MAG: hypothetical protein RL213_1747 [Bacteroidota bacterium]|jgi:hypothetical protein